FTTEGFKDIALSATFDGEGKRIVAGDWTGAVRVFDAANGKPVGELSVDPPTIAERLDVANKHLPEAQSAYDQAAADAQAANVAVADATKSLEQAQARQKSLADSVKSADVAAKTARDAVG